MQWILIPYAVVVFLLAVGIVAQRFWFRLKGPVLGYLLRSWSTILLFGQVAMLAVLSLLVWHFWAQKWDVLGILLTCVFGVASFLSFLVSVLVLLMVRDLIVDYTQAGPKFQEVINRATNTLFVLTENPAFLQAVRPSDLTSWLEVLRKRLADAHFIRVTFAYIYRERLVGKKFKMWADMRKTTREDMSGQLKNSYTFSLTSPPETRPKVFFVPLTTDELPFYIAIADADKAGMFCRSKDVGPDIRKWELRGFLSFDPYIVSALREVFLKFLQLNAGVYEYVCVSCTGKIFWRHSLDGSYQSCETDGQTRVYFFDHDLMALGAEGAVTVDAQNLQNTITVKCPSCAGPIQTATLTEISKLPDPRLRSTLFRQITGEDWSQARD